MDFKVDYYRIRDIGDEVLKKQEDLVNTFGDLITIIEELNNGWAGPDYDNFKTISTTYIKELEPLTDKIQIIGECMKKASVVYEGNDSEWESQVKSIGDSKYEG